jgi:hypothetical protein
MAIFEKNIIFFSGVIFSSSFSHEENPGSGLDPDPDRYSA